MTKSPASASLQVSATSVNSNIPTSKVPAVLARAGRHLAPARCQSCVPEAPDTLCPVGPQPGLPDLPGRDEALVLFFFLS